MHGHLNVKIVYIPFTFNLKIYVAVPADERKCLNIFSVFTMHIVTIHIYSPTHAHFLNDTIKL